MEISELKRIANHIRGMLVEISHQSRSPHLGSSLSCVDILVAAYWGNVLAITPENPTDPNRDRFILSKGHAAPTLYTVLAHRGFFPNKLLEDYNQAGSNLAEHPTLGCVPGVEASTGSLGHGLPLGVGMALAGRIQKHPYRVFVTMSDGECNEGSVWEAAMITPAQKLDNIVVIIDYNKWQATGRSNKVMALDPLVDKWQAFGWSTYELDGHDMDSLIQVMRNVPDRTGKPIAVIAHTVKGKGVSFMEDDNNWHYRIPSADEVILAKQELGLL